MKEVWIDWLALVNRRAEEAGVFPERSPSLSVAPPVPFQVTDLLTPAEETGAAVTSAFVPSGEKSETDGPGSFGSLVPTFTVIVAGVVKFIP